MPTVSISNNRTLYQGAALMIALTLFVVGRFGFFDILGLKRLFEVMLLLPLGILGILLILRIPAQWLNPFLLLPFSYLITQAVMNWNTLLIADLINSILIIGTIIALGEIFSDLLLRYLIRIATFFAVLGIIEFGILLLKPSLVSQILLFYDSYSGSSVPVIQNALQLLGLSDGTSYHLWGMSVTRLRSFTSEPSLLVGYLLVPGALGLTYRGKFAFLGMLCITFCICSLAGSVFVAMLFSIGAFMMTFFRSRRLFILFPFMILTLFIYILFTHYSELILLTHSSAGSYDFLDKTNSANMRFSYILEFIPKAFSSPFGVSEDIYQPLGLLVGGMAKGGYIGLFITLIILIKLYSSLAVLLVSNHLRLGQKVGLSIVYGALVTGILYLDNCFVQLYGFTLLLLVYNRLRQMQAGIVQNEMLKSEQPAAA